MVVALVPACADKIVFSDRLWRALAAGAAAAAALSEGITDASFRGRGARGQAGVDAQRNGVPASWSRGLACQAGMAEAILCGTSMGTTPLCSPPLLNREWRCSRSRGWLCKPLS